jgi:VCBS repeat protein
VRGLAAAALLLLPVALGSAGPRDTPFRSPRLLQFPGGSPSALASGDFDGDGKRDLVVASGGTEEGVVFLGDGKGGLRRATTFAAGPDPTEIAVGDFDGDGRPDLAIANHGVPRVTILLGNGRGGFRPAPGSPLTVRSRPHPHTIAACDLDGDRKLDLVIDSFQENRFTLLRGDGRGGFAVPGEAIEAGRRPYRNLRLADLDGDGRCDLVAANFPERSVTLLIGNGRGGFSGASSPISPAGPSPFAIALGDLDHDGKVDLILANYSGHISDPGGDGLTFLLNQGGGRFRLGPKIPTGRGSGDAASGDVDGDGFADAVTANAGSEDLTIAYGGPGGLSPSRVAAAAAGGKCQRVMLADLDGDGKADAVTANTESHSVSVLLTGRH